MLGYRVTPSKVIAFRVVLIVLASLMGGLTWFGRDCLRASPLPLEEYPDGDDERSIDEWPGRVRLRFDCYYSECLNMRIEA